MAEPQPRKALAQLSETYLAGGGNRIAYLNAAISSEDIFTNKDVRSNLHCEQADRQLFLGLEYHGFKVSPFLLPGEKKFQICLVVIGKFKAKNEAMISRARALAESDGLIIVAGAKNTGVGSLRKRISVDFTIQQSLAKHHSIAFSFHNGAVTHEKSADLTEWTVKTKRREYLTAPGLFSAEKIDAGSAMLVEHFAGLNGGLVADLGAGWGYLSAEAIATIDNISGLDMYEADWHGVVCCRKNICEQTSHINTQAHWLDVVNEPVAKKYDTIIMNPPFHQGKKLANELGQGFITTAARILKPGGRMLMVANRHLPYEELLHRLFSRVCQLEENGIYKIISATR